MSSTPWGDIISNIAGHINNTNTNIANLGSTLMTNLFNRRNVDKNNELQMWLANQANQWQIDQRNYENWYNSPSGLQSRGLNPALAMSAGGASLAASVNSGEAHVADTDAFHNIAPQFSSPSQDILAMSQARLNEADAKKKEAEIPVLKNQAEKLLVEAGEAANRCELLGQEIAFNASTLYDRINTTVLELQAKGDVARLDREEANAKLRYVSESAKAVYDTLLAQRDFAVKHSQVAGKQLEILDKSLDQLKLEVERGERDLDWYTADKIMGYLTGLASAFSGAVIATSNYRTSKLLRKGKKSVSNSIDLDDYDIGQGVID